MANSSVGCRVRRIGLGGACMDTDRNGEENRRSCPEGEHAFVTVMLVSHGWYRVSRVCMRCGYICHDWTSEDILVADGPGIGRLIRPQDRPGMRVISLSSFKVRYLPKEHEWR